MKKIPTLFRREFIDNHTIKIINEVTPGMEWVLSGEGIATVKMDGACCAVIDGLFYRRYDAKNGRKIPDGAIKCQDEADPITGHLPCWVKCSRSKSDDKWFWSAFDRCLYDFVINDVNIDGTYEAIGPHFNGNPYNLDYDIMVSHGRKEIFVERSFEGIRDYLSRNYIEGMVFWKDGEPKCKIKRSDFGFKWN